MTDEAMVRFDYCLTRGYCSQRFMEGHPVKRETWAYVSMDDIPMRIRQLIIAYDDAPGTDLKGNFVINLKWLSGYGDVEFNTDPFIKPYNWSAIENILNQSFCGIEQFALSRPSLRERFFPYDGDGYSERCHRQNNVAHYKHIKNILGSNITTNTN